MALQTSGFSLSALPQAPTIPSNIGVVDVDAIHRSVLSGLAVADKIRQDRERQQLEMQQNALNTQKALAGMRVLPSVTQQQINEANQGALLASEPIAQSKFGNTLATNAAATQGALNQYTGEVFKGQASTPAQLAFGNPKVTNDTVVRNPDGSSTATTNQAVVAGDQSVPQSTSTTNIPSPQVTQFGPDGRPLGTLINTIGPNGVQTTHAQAYPSAVLTGGTSTIVSVGPQVDTDPQTGNQTFHFENWQEHRDGSWKMVGKETRNLVQGADGSFTAPQPQYRPASQTEVSAIRGAAPIAQGAPAQTIPGTAPATPGTAPATPPVAPLAFKTRPQAAAEAAAATTGQKAQATSDVKQNSEIRKTALAEQKAAADLGPKLDRLALAYSNQSKGLGAFGPIGNALKGGALGSMLSSDTQESKNAIAALSSDTMASLKASGASRIAVQEWDKAMSQIGTTTQTPEARMNAVNYANAFRNTRSARADFILKAIDSGTPAMKAQQEAIKAFPEPIFGSSASAGKPTQKPLATAPSAPDFIVGKQYRNKKTGELKEYGGQDASGNPIWK